MSGKRPEKKSVNGAECGCAVQESGSSRKALGVDADIKSRNLKRL